MDSIFKIDFKETNPLWEKFEKYLLSDEIHVIRFEISKNMEFIQAKLDLLSEVELKKSERFARQVDRSSFLASSVMKKILCASYLHIDPQAVEFEKNEYHKPKIKIRNDIHFNTSHSGNWLVFIFSSKP
jgi:4'-phosphopantetheinyl transferase